MNDTPRTDEATFKILSRLQSGTEDVVRAEVARGLERELAVVTKENDKFWAEKLRSHFLGRKMTIDATHILDEAIRFIEVGGKEGK